MGDRYFYWNASRDMEKVVDWNEWKWASTLISFLLLAKKKSSCGKIDRRAHL
jgi:hypothetical protein